VVQTTEGTSCTSEISLPRLHTLSAILDGAPINVGELIADTCEEQECDLFANNVSAAMMNPITDTYMDGFVKDYHERMHAIMVAEVAVGQPPPPHQPQPPQS